MIRTWKEAARRSAATALGSSLLLLSGCLWGGSDAPDHCSVDIVGIEEWRSAPGAFDTSYRVRGKAGSAAVVWLAARVGSGRFLSGKGVDVGPGPFEAIVDLDLTGPPLEYLAVLEVAGRRCRATAPMPGS
jgi:hypothetical protein